MHVAGDPRQPQVAGAALQISVALDAFQRLIAAAAVGANVRVLRDGDFVVDGDVTEIDVVNPDAVPVLPDGRVALQLLHVRLVISFEPGVADVNLGVNGNGAGTTAANRNVTGVGEHFEINGPADLVGPIESPNHGSPAGQGADNDEREHL